MRRFNTAVLVGAFAASLWVCGCASAPPTVEEWHAAREDPEKSLQITVESVPPGAAVYGSVADAPGTLIGETPITLKYAAFRRHGSFGPVPFETLVNRWRPRHRLFLRRGNAYLAFKCFLIKEGYEPYRMYEVIQDDTFRFFTRRVKMAGVSRTFAAVLTPLTPEVELAPAPEQAPQPQEQQ